MTSVTVNGDPSHLQSPPSTLSSIPNLGSMADLSDMALRIILGVVSAFTAAARFAPGFVLGAGLESDRQKHADAARLAMRSLKLGS
jgi:hypothetical protein